MYCFSPVLENTYHEIILKTVGQFKGQRVRLFRFAQQVYICHRASWGSAVR